MLRGGDFFALGRVAGGKRGQTLVLLIGLVVTAFLVERQETVEAHHRSGGAKFGDPPPLDGGD